MQRWIDHFFHRFFFHNTKLDSATVWPGPYNIMQIYYNPTFDDEVVAWWLVIWQMGKIIERCVTRKWLLDHLTIISTSNRFYSMIHLLPKGKYSYWNFNLFFRYSKPFQFKIKLKIEFLFFQSFPAWMKQVITHCTVSSSSFSE